MSAARRRRLQRLQRQAERRGRSPLLRLATALAVLLAALALMAVVATATGRFVLPAELTTTRAATSASPTEVSRQRELVVRVVDHSGRPDLAVEVAELAAPGGFSTFAGPARGEGAESTRILVHRDAPEVVAAAADLRDLLGLGVIERVAAAPEGIDLTVVVGADYAADTASR
ncbi:LytR C-terminal domain-containing protein [Egicoccus sp. AB-alg6-2]|uniref:LytR C-terminal domain-containing protein n=1 Tax=Egicoccus sp. AB-alg6-2 TaxID=3242692 RepID=UPI00359EC49F